MYPKWLEILAPNLNRVEHPSDLKENNYYLFSGGGIPSIYNHVANAAEDIIKINSQGEIKIDYLIVCIDTEDESREYILEQIKTICADRGINIFYINVED